MSFFDTAAGQGLCEQISYSLDAIAQELKRQNELKTAEMVAHLGRDYFDHLMSTVKHGDEK